MKLLNILKKEQELNTTKLQKLDKNQLEKVIGGGDGMSSSSTDMAITKSGGATKGGTYSDKKI